MTKTDWCDLTDNTAIFAKILSLLRIVDITLWYFVNALIVGRGIHL